MDYVESWLPIAGYEGFYEVSDAGRVRSIPRVVTGARGRSYKRKGVVLSQATDSTGYRCVVLQRDGKPRTRTVHRLVAEAWIPNPEGHPEVNHADGDKANNTTANLHWVSHKENSRHASRMRLYSHGERHYSAKLDEPAVRTIRSLLAQRRSLASIAREFGVTGTSIAQIRDGKTWTHVLELG